MVLIEIEPCQAETMRVIGMAEDYVKRNKIKKGQIWCVYDKDSFPPERFNSIVERAENLNKENIELQYYTAWSNECIEFWFLLHFAYYTANNHRTEYITFLNNKFKELGIGKYQKNIKFLQNICQNNRCSFFVQKQISFVNYPKHQPFIIHKLKRTKKGRRSEILCEGEKCEKKVMKP